MVNELLYLVMVIVALCPDSNTVLLQLIVLALGMVVSANVWLILPLPTKELPANVKATLMLFVPSLLCPIYPEVTQVLAPPTQ